MNWLTDMDWGWWPLLLLRPPKNQDIDNSVLLKMTGFFGPLTGLLVFLVRLRQIESLTATGVALHLFFGSLGFFLLYKFSFARFWNRRARRLRNDQISRCPEA